MDAEQAFGSLVETLRKDRRVGTAKMFGAEGLKVHDKYFAMLYKGRLVVKLPKERVEALVKAKDGVYFDPGHGRLMKEWVAIQPGAQSRWLRLAEEARDFVDSAAKGAGGRKPRKKPK
ncbi:MAG: hypothetical protein ACRDFW_09280 [bacterium]